MSKGEKWWYHSHQYYRGIAMGQSLLRYALVFVTLSFCSVVLADTTKAQQGSPESIRLRWREDGIDFLEMSLESQIFRGSRWRHVLTLAKPVGTLRKHTALVTVWGGLDPGEQAFAGKTSLTDPELVGRLKAQVRATGGVVAAIGQIPFQPLFDGKQEDAAISYTLGKFFETGDETWPLLIPMTKAVSGALDAIERVSRSEWHRKITGVVLTGASKRGWTTWLSGASDHRVKAIAPEVFDILNIPNQLEHQRTSWGQYSSEIGDYSQNGLPKMLATPRGDELLRLIDPYRLRHRLTIPKLVILGTNDAYWPVDAASLYFDELAGKKYLLYIPNARHEITDRAVINENLKVLARAVEEKSRLPKVKFAHTPLKDSKDGLEWRMKVSQVPLACSLWSARSKSRDFRQASWSETVSLDPKQTVQVVVSPAKELYTASFIKVVFDVGGSRFTVTSLVKILPPQKISDGEGKQTSL